MDRWRRADGRRRPAALISTIASTGCSAAPAFCRRPDPGDAAGVPPAADGACVSLDPKLEGRTRWCEGSTSRPMTSMLRAAFFTVAGDRAVPFGGWTPWSTSVQLPDGVSRSRFPWDRGSLSICYTALPRLRPQGAASSWDSMQPYGRRARGDRHRAEAGRRTPARKRRAACVANTPCRPRAVSWAVRVEMSSGQANRSSCGRGAPTAGPNRCCGSESSRTGLAGPYVFRRPVALPAGSVIQTVTYFD